MRLPLILLAINTIVQVCPFDTTEHTILVSILIIVLFVKTFQQIQFLASGSSVRDCHFVAVVITPVGTLGKNGYGGPTSVSAPPQHNRAEPPAFIVSLCLDRYS